MTRELTADLKALRLHGMSAAWADLVNALEQEKTQGRAGRIAASLLRMDLVILDSCGVLGNVKWGFRHLMSLCSGTESNST